MRYRTPRSALVIAYVTLLVLARTSTGQTDDGKAGEVSIQPQWKVGDKQRYERVKTRRRTSGGKVTAKGSARGPVDVSVVEAGEEGFLVRWRMGKITLDDPKVAANSNVHAVNRLIEGLTIDIELDNEATITGLRNWAEMKATGAKLIDHVIESQRTAGVDAKILASVRPPLEAMFSTKERIEQSFTKEPLTFFLPIGRVYPKVGKPMEYDDLLPNPLEGPPFPCKGAITLTSYEPAKGRAVVAWTQTPDPKETDRIISETLKLTFPRPAQFLPEADELKPSTIVDRAEFVIDTKTGWIEQYTYTRSMTTEDGSMEDILSMTRQPKPR
ncbi:hypothetical protein SAMN05444166_6443 [Singulisphaera sp. GP187]|uniref:hypothetical protein n=1 Tax=Singulisphaera sp. GP187 TaxID=1882752 RepID=UPI00092692F5|nr:hypothetical protein [Singulisphaera sp. GP187]SIO60568.1 hypothetical protein SAMN05444166_6443 [Singulisphaera sp. GP187]